MQELQDIIAAPPASWWPPAPGWWLLAFVVVTGTATIGYYSWRHWQRGRIKRLALAQLKHMQQPQFDATTLLLKQAALGYFPRERIAALSGNQWQQFLLETMPTKQRSRWQSELEHIMASMYHANKNPELARSYYNFAHTWLVTALPPQHGVQESL